MVQILLEAETLNNHPNQEMKEIQLDSNLEGTAFHRSFAPHMSKFEQLLAIDAVSLGALRKLEEEVGHRNRLRVGLAYNLNPLWFFAETEANVFLWRKGRSISEKANFSFWVDIKSLVSKRIGQLELSANSGNPFTNPFFGASSNFAHDPNAEVGYLRRFMDCVGVGLTHLSALCIAAEMIDDSSKPLIILPAFYCRH